MRAAEVEPGKLMDAIERAASHAEGDWFLVRHVCQEYETPSFGNRPSYETIQRWLNASVQTGYLVSKKAGHLREYHVRTTL